MHDRRLARAGNNQARAPVILQICDHRLEPVAGNAARRLSGGCFNAHAPRDRASEGLDFAGHQRQAVIGHRTGDRRRALDGEQTIHRAAAG